MLLAPPPPRSRVSSPKLKTPAGGWRKMALTPVSVPEIVKANGCAARRY